MIKNKKVIVIGCFGYQNMGDEAQLSYVVNFWKGKISKNNIKVLSPNPRYTSKFHKVNSAFASRVVFFKEKNSDDFKLSTNIFKRYFFIKYFQLIIFYYLQKIGLNFFFSKSEINYINEIKSASLVHFCGGGYMTGATKSRLWDGYFVIKICQLYRIKFVMSGQTLGLFNGFFDWYFAKKLLTKSELIGIRDHKSFSRDILSLNIAQNKIFYVADDATFCDYVTHSKKEKKQFISKKKKILFHFHKRFSEKKYQKFLEHILNFLNQVDKKKYNIYLIPMVPKDRIPLNDLRKLLNFRTKILDFKFDFKKMKGFISESTLVITFKHHPIIFSGSTSTNCAAIVPDEYYLRKNKSAFKKLGLENNIITDKQVFNGELHKIFNKVVNQKVNNKKKLKFLKKQQEKFYEKIMTCLK